MRSPAARLWKQIRPRHSQKRRPPASRARRATRFQTHLSQVHISSLNSHSNNLRTLRLPAVTMQPLHSTYWHVPKLCRSQRTLVQPAVHRRPGRWGASRRLHQIQTQHHLHSRYTTERLGKDQGARLQ